MSFFHTSLRHLGSEILALRDRHLHTVVLAPDGNGAVVFGNPGFRHHLARIYLDTDAPFKTLWRLHPSDSRASLQDCIRTFGLAVGPRGLLPDIPAFPAIQVPQYLNLVIDLPADLQDFVPGLSKSLGRNIRKIRSLDFSYHSTRDPEILESFRRNYLNPTLSLRHGAETFSISRSNLRERMINSNCHLIQLLHRGEWVAGGIRREDEHGYHSVCLGWKDADPQILKSGAVTALYMETISKAYERGKNRLFLGGTLPYLEDGVFAFKAKWKARIDATPGGYQLLSWHFDPAHPQLRRFLERHSIVACGHYGRWVVYSAQNPKPGRTYREVLRSISVWYRLRDQPGPSSEATHPDVPIALRPWFEPCIPKP